MPFHALPLPFSDLRCPSHVWQVAVAAIEKVLGGNSDAVFDLSYSKRQDFLSNCPSYPSEWVPTLCVACCERRPNVSLLSPTIHYTALRYGELPLQKNHGTPP